MTWGRIVRPGGANMPRLLNSTQAGRMVRPMGGRRSEYITTRCYAADGTQLWDGDHGNTVLALAVGADGTVYQCGVEYSAGNTGDSLFHRYADSQQPMVTAMAFGGRPIWAMLVGAGTGYAEGIAVAASGYVYCGVNAATPYLAKLDAADGDDVLHLPVTDFIRATNSPPATTPPFVSGVSAPTWGRVRVDGSNNVYALGETDGNVTQSVYKWVSDQEYWLFDEQFMAHYAATGMAVSTSGVIATSSRPATVGSSPINTPLFYLTSGATGNLSPAAFSSYTAKATKPYFGEPGYPPSGVGGYNQAGISPDGTKAVTYDDMNDQIISVAVGGTPDTPTVTNLVSLAALGGSVLRPFTAMAINDSGVYCYSIPRGTLTPDGTHDIRAADNSLIARLDHGGAIFDAVVLPDGRVIVAGERVARADFP